MDQEQIDRDLQAILSDLSMNQTVTFLRPAETTQQPDGSVDVAWTPLAEDVPANIEKRNSKEVLGPQLVVLKEYYSVIPQSMPEGLNLLCRIEWNNREMEITAIKAASFECVDTKAQTT